MNNREVALEFIRRFCAGDGSGLAPLLAEDLRLKGPLFEFDSSAAYLESLEGSLETCGHRVLSVTESEDAVSVYYDYVKSGGTLTVSQLFKFKDGKIGEILLVFDSHGFAQ